MKRVDRYLLAESLPPLLFGLVLYSTLAVVSATLSRLQWLVGAPIADVAVWLGLQYPLAIVQTLPIAVVLAVLLAFGRLATDNELLAMQAGAVPLGRISRVFVVLGLIATLAALSLNQWVLPVTNARVGSLYWEMTAGGSGLFRLAGQSLPVEGFTLNFERVDRQTEEIFDVRIERWDDRQVGLIFADRAEFVESGLRLYGYRTLALDLSAIESGSNAAEPSETLQELVRASGRAADPDSSLLLTMESGADELVTRFSQGGFIDPRSISEVYADANDGALPVREQRSAAVLFHRMLAEPFASLVLLLVALPLSLTYARSRSVAFGLSLVVTLAWYLLLTLGQLLGQTGELPVWLGVWLANIVLGAAGLYLLSRQVVPK
ncbi:MAG TPA: LptF/LptG family permease [Trueperaceae bacterium]